MPILSYTLNPNNGVIPPEPIPPVPPGPTPDPIEGPSTLSIILGITIPFGIVCNIFIYFSDRSTLLLLCSKKEITAISELIELVKKIILIN
jgi:hypothetical protein